MSGLPSPSAPPQSRGTYNKYVSPAVADGVGRTGLFTIGVLSKCPEGRPPFLPPSTAALEGFPRVQNGKVFMVAGLGYRQALWPSSRLPASQQKFHIRKIRNLGPVKFS